MQHSRLIVSVHGIRTYGHWQERLGALLQAQDERIDYCAYKYGYFSVLAFLIPPLRWLVVRRFRAQLLKLYDERKPTRLDLVGHSFGTHLIAWSLLSVPTSSHLRVNNIILAGSVLRPGFPWHELQASGRVWRIINDCGLNDQILLLNQLAVLFTGMAGRIGLAGFMRDRLQNRYFSGGHSHYFVDHLGRESNEFMVRYWLPVLASDSPVEAVDQRGVPTAWQGIVRTIVQNIEPLKLGLYLSLILIPALAYRNLYLEANVERDRAEAQRAEATVQRAAAVAQLNDHLKTLEWAISETFTMPVNYASVEMAPRGAAALIKGLARRLEAAGFEGTIYIEWHTSGWMQSREYSIGIAERYAQSVRRAIIESGLPSKIDVTSVSYGEEQPKYCEPPKGTSEAEFKRVAMLNNRMQLRLIPSGQERSPLEPRECIPYERPTVPEDLAPAK